MKTIKQILQKVSDNMPHIEVVVVDTLNAYLSNKEMDDRKMQGFEKWTDLAGDGWDLYQFMHGLREDLIGVIVAHSKAYEENGFTKYRTKTPGKKLDDLNLASVLTYNLYTELVQNGDDIEHYFVTRSAIYEEARALYGVLPVRMKNDLAEVVRLIRQKDLMLDQDQPQSSTSD